MNPQCFVGIDPGASGAIAWIADGAPAVEKLKTTTDRDIIDLLRQMKGNWPDAVAYIEHVASRPGQGVCSVFKFGVSYGGLCMALVAAGIPFERVTPGVWQRGLRCLSKGDKNVTKRRAQELFPSVKITHAVADALLIAEHCRRSWGGAHD